MIGKLIATSKRQSKSVLITNLVHYATGEQMDNAAEKVSHVYASGLFAETTAGRVEEMTSLAVEAPRCTTPILHIVLSLRQGEHPTAPQVAAMTETALKELGLTGHQAIAALHEDTEHRHVHLIVNRIDPYTSRPVRVHNGWTINALHQAVARIEFQQGWAREKRGLFEVDEHGRIVRAGKQPAPAVEAPKIAARAGALEARTGVQSDQRTASQRLAPVIARAGSWAELHASLAAVGAEYRAKGSGGIIVHEGVALKASSIAKAAAITQLAKRFDASYQPGPDVAVTPIPRDAPAPWRALHRAVETSPLPMVAPGAALPAGWLLYVAQAQRDQAEHALSTIQLQRAAAEVQAALDADHQRQRAASGTASRAGLEQLRHDWQRDLEALATARRARRLKKPAAPSFAGYTAFLAARAVRRVWRIARRRLSQIGLSRDLPLVRRSGDVLLEHHKAAGVAAQDQAARTTPAPQVPSAAPSRPVGTGMRRPPPQQGWGRD